MLMRLMILSSLLSGCALFEGKPPRLMQDNFRLIFVFDDNPMLSDPQAVASATWFDGFCIIKMRPEYYTHNCLGHELRHCLEGDWHKGRKEPC